MCFICSESEGFETNIGRIIELNATPELEVGNNQPYTPSTNGSLSTIHIKSSHNYYWKTIDTVKNVKNNLITYFIDSDGISTSYESQTTGTNYITSSSIPDSLTTFIDNSFKSLDKILNINFTRVYNREDAILKVVHVNTASIPGQSSTTYGIGSSTYTDKYYDWNLGKLRANNLSLEAVIRSDYIYRNWGNLDYFHESTILHEIGHLLTLEHPFEDDDGDVYGTEYGSTAVDISETIMAYEDNNQPYTDWYTSLDIKALKEIWGENFGPTDMSIYGFLSEDRTAIIFDENIEAGTSVGNLKAIDENENDTHTFSFVDGYVESSGNQYFYIDGNEIKIKSSPDYETKNSYQVVIKATDDSGVSSPPRAFTFMVTDLAEGDTTPPVITLPTSTDHEGIPTLYLDENITAVHTYVADEEVTWSLSADLSSATDYTNFTINSSTGALSFNTAPDYENPIDSGGYNIYALTVNATDTAENISSQRLWVVINDVVNESDMEKPIIYGENNDVLYSLTSGTFASSTSINVSEGTNKEIYRFIANEEVTWSISQMFENNDHQYFSIDPVTGSLSINGNLDYEKPQAGGDNNFYIMSINATDTAGNINNSNWFRVIITDVVDESIATSNSATSTELQQLYIGYFGRPCDPTGLDYWLDQGVTKKAFAANMYLQPEFNSVNGNLSTEAQVNQIYLNLFNREGDAAGLIYWASQIDSGNLELASIANDLTWAALNNAGSEVDKKTLTHKTNAGVQYTYEIRKSTASILAYQPKSTSPWITGNNLTEAKTFIKEVGYSKVATLSEIQGSIAKFSSTPKSLKLIDSDNPNYSIDIVTGLSLDNFSNESTEDLRQAEIAFDNNFSILDQQIENNKLNYVELSDHFTNQKYISNLYEEVLDRNSDIEGLNYCIDQLETIVESRFEVSLGYSSSIENPLIPSDTLLA